MDAFSLKKIKKLRLKKYRDEYSLYVVEGKKGVEEAMASGAHIVAICATSEFSMSLAFQTDIPITAITEKEGKEITSTETFSGLLAVIQKKSPVFDDGHILCFDRVADPGNVGTMIRTADWFGVRNMLFAKGSVDPFNPKVVRSTMGSFFHAAVEESSDIVTRLKELVSEGYTLVALDLQGEPITAYQKKEKMIFVFGSESHGVDPEILALADTLSIEGRGEAESLNVATAAAIALHQLT